MVREIVESCKNNKKKVKAIAYPVLWKCYSDEEGTREIYDKLKGTAKEGLLKHFEVEVRIQINISCTEHCRWFFHGEEFQTGGSVMGKH